MATTGASLQLIYERLNETPTYHPLEADMFADWSLEAGDVITVGRGENYYESPVHTVTHTWKGQPAARVSSGGDERRNAVAKVSRRKYAGGGSGARSGEYFRKEFENVYNGLSSYIVLTESVWETHLSDAYNGLSSTVTQTASMWQSNLTDAYNGLSSTVTQTASLWESHLDDAYNGLSSTVTQTASMWQSSLTDTYNGLSSTVTQTASLWESHLDDAYNGLSSTVTQTASLWQSNLTDAYRGLSSTVTQTASEWSSNLRNAYAGLSSRVSQTASSWSASIAGVVGQDGKVTAASIAVAINETGSNASISADRINLSGDTTLFGALEIENGELVVKKTAVFQGSGTGNLVTINNGSVSGNTFNVNSGGSVRFIGSQTGEYYDLNTSEVSTMIVKAEHDTTTNTLKLWKFGDPEQSPSITFSKAALTSLVGTWSGSTLTVTPAGQSSPSLGVDIGTGVDGNGRSDFSILATSRQESESSYTTRASQYLYIKEVINGLNSVVNVCTSNDGTGIIGSVSTRATYEAGGGGAATTFSANWTDNVLKIRPDVSGTAALDIDFIADANGNGSDSFSILAKSKQGSESSYSTRASKYMYIKEVLNGEMSRVDVCTNNDGTGMVGSVSTSPTYYLGRTNGRNGVEINKGQWSGGRITFSKSVGTPSNQTVQLVASDDVTWTGNEGSKVIWDGTAADAQHGVSTGYTVTIDATDRYNAGQNIVTINKGQWSGGRITFSKSAGTPSNQTVQLVASDDITWTGNEGSKTIWDGTAPDAQHGTPTGYTVTIDATDRYNAGQNIVTIVKGSWSGGRITFSKSAGTPSNQTVQLVASDDVTWTGNEGSKVIWDGTAADAQHGVSTGYTVTINATTRYNAGRNVVTIKKGSWSGGKITFSKSAGTASNQTVQLVAASTTWSGNTASRVIWDGTAADAQHGVSTGYTVTVNAATRYNAGWAAAYGKVTLPGSSTSSASMVVKTPPSTVDGTATSTTFTVSVDNNYAYIKKGSTTVARTTNTAYDNGYNAGVTAGRGEAHRITLDSGMNVWKNSSDGYYYANALVYNSSGTLIKSINVNQSTSNPSGIRLPVVANKSITANGTYSAKTTDNVIGYGSVVVNVPTAGSASSINLDNFIVDSQKPSVVGSYTALSTMSNLINNNHRTYIWFRATITGGSGAKWYQVTLN